MDIQGINISSKQSKPVPLSGKNLANEIIVFADNHSAAVTEEAFRNKLYRMDKLSAEELIKFIRAFGKDESIIELICDEVGCKGDTIKTLDGKEEDIRKWACKKVMKALVKQAKELKVDDLTCSNLENKFNSELNIQFRKIGFIDTVNLDSIINTMVQHIENRLPH